MKKLKRLFALSTLLIFVLCNFTGCSGSSSGSGNPNKDGTEQGAEGQDPAPDGSDDEEDGEDEDDEEDDGLPENPELKDLVPDAQMLGEFTAAQAIEKINSLESGNYAIKITGEITEDDIENIKTAMFTNTNRFIALDLSETTGLKKLQERAFSKTGTDEDGYWCAYGVPLTALILPECITEIGDSCFQKCINLKAVIAPGVIILRSYAFNDCDVLVTLKFADVMDLLEECAIGWMDSITTITLNAKRIGERMVSGCDKLTTVRIGPDVEFFDTEPFTDCCSVNEFIVLKGNKHFKSIDGALYTADGTELIRYPPALEKTEFTLPDEVTVIDNWSFSYCETKKVSLQKIKCIPEYAFFASQAIQEVSIPAAEEIEDSAFEYCPSLRKIQLPTSLKTIKGEAFSRSNGLKNIYIPSSVKTMGPYVFSEWSSEQTINFQCQEDSIPEGWDSEWNIDRFSNNIIPATINWGVDPE